MDKDLMRDAGFNEQIDKVEQRKCPFCGKDINPLIEFKDASSKKEFGISGLCQKCQDKMFK